MIAYSLTEVAESWDGGKRWIHSWTSLTVWKLFV